jgi:hypothetical protein
MGQRQKPTGDVDYEMGETADTGTATRTYQEGTKEDEGDEVKVGKITPTLTGVGIRVTGPVTQTRQHDLVPGLPSSTPEKKSRAVSTQRQVQRGVSSNT